MNKRGKPIYVHKQHEGKQRHGTSKLRTHQKIKRTRRRDVEVTWATDFHLPTLVRSCRTGNKPTSADSIGSVCSGHTWQSLYADISSPVRQCSKEHRFGQSSPSFVPFQIIDQLFKRTKTSKLRTTNDCCWGRPQRHNYLKPLQWNWWWEGVYKQCIRN